MKNAFSNPPKYGLQDGGEVGQVLPAVLLPLGPGGQPAFRVVVHHGGGEAVVSVEADNLPVPVGDI